MEFVNKLRLSACTVRFSLVKYDTLKKGNGQETNSRTILFCRNMKTLTHSKRITAAADWATLKSKSFCAVFCRTCSLPYTKSVSNGKRACPR